MWWIVLDFGVSVHTQSLTAAYLHTVWYVNTDSGMSTLSKSTLTLSMSTLTLSMSTLTPSKSTLTLLPHENSQWNNSVNTCQR
eukprot:3027694-Rhodomonas_salina.2